MYVFEIYLIVIISPEHGETTWVRSTGTWSSRMTIGGADQGSLLTGHSHCHNLCPHELGYGAPTTMVIYPLIT